jgi:hypothetical protein
MAKFQPGNIANPTGSDGGKKRLNKQLADLLMHNVPKAVKLVEKSLNSAEFEEHRWAVDTVFNRVYGKAPESIELTGPDGSPLAVMLERALTPEEFASKFAPKSDE